MKQESLNNVEMGIDNFKKNFLNLREKGSSLTMINELAQTKISQLELGDDHLTT